MGAGWSTADIPQDVAGRRVIVTGANSGIGYYAALALGIAGADVAIACRSKERGEAALAELRKEATAAGAPNALFSLRLLDLASQKDIRRFADEYNSEDKPLDILINNAGIMMPPYEVTEDGFESQLAANHLGPFALTGLLMPSLERSYEASGKTRKPRVVAVASMASWRVMAKPSPIDFKKAEATYDKMAVYGESKLANLLFTRELSRRHPHIVATAAHPGGSSTNLQRYQFGFAKSICQSAANGALPTIRAACEDEANVSVEGNSFYFGPRGLGWAGCPTYAWIPPFAKDAAFAAEYWEASAKATGVDY